MYDFFFLFLSNEYFEATGPIWMNFVLSAIEDGPAVVPFHFGVVVVQYWRILAKNLISEGTNYSVLDGIIPMLHMILGLFGR